jgi:uncharacterized membrane protein YagU involved in acid resistance
MKCVFATLFGGIVGGLAGAAAMHGFRLLWEAATDHREKDAIYGFDHEADVNSAHLLASRFGSSLSERQAARLGIVLHYMYGGMLGSLYAAVHGHNGRLSQRRAALFGVALWVCGDEIPVVLSGISNPKRKNATSHTGALLAHLVFALTLENALTCAALGRTGHDCAV